MSRSKSVYVIVIIILLTVSLANAGPYNNSRAVAVSGGENHTLVLTADANLWACGDNGWYQLGIGDGDDTYDKKLLVRVHDGNMVTASGYLENIIAMNSGWKHSLAVDVNNHVWAWGDNDWGELGDDTVWERKTPVQVKSGEQDPGHPNTFLQNIIAVSAGRSGQYSLALDDSNHCWSWGLNNLGQLGDGSTAFNRLTPVQVEGGEMGTTWLEGIVCISAGEAHSAAVDSNGGVWTWGENKFEELTGRGKLGVGTALEKTTTAVHVLRGAQPGTGTYLEHIVEVSVGWDHTVALEDYWPFDPNRLGRVYSWGANLNSPGSRWGRLGDGTKFNRSTPAVVHAGEQNSQYPDSNLIGIVAVSAGDRFSVALEAEGYVLAWGENKNGEVGDGSTTMRTRPVHVKRGDNDQPLSGIVAISAAYWHSLAIDINGTIA